MAKCTVIFTVIGLLLHFNSNTNDLERHTHIHRAQFWYLMGRNISGCALTRGKSNNVQIKEEFQTRSSYCTSAFYGLGAVERASDMLPSVNSIVEAPDPPRRLLTMPHNNEPLAFVRNSWLHKLQFAAGFEKNERLKY